MKVTVTCDIGVAGKRLLRKLTPGDQPTKKRAWLGWIPLFLLPAAASVCRSRLAPWEFMWLLAIASFAGCKWQTWFRAWNTDASILRNLGYLFFWPGMNAPQFLDEEHKPPRPRVREWFAAILQTTLGIGIVLVWFAVRHATRELLVDGWIGMLGLILILHFGTFHLVSLAWQTTGVDARPIMRAPLLATSLGEFWGKRWNIGFRQLSHGIVFQPVCKRLGAPPAILAAFLFSGIVHDLVISIPARGGYGLPTAYFILQGIGVLFERSSIGVRAGIDWGFRGRAFALLWAAAPVYWLFHPAFITRVMLPFFATLGSHGI